jgi:ABC-type glycerol-3-phosphate transport system substrate-binding protein
MRHGSLAGRIPAWTRRRVATLAAQAAGVLATATVVPTALAAPAPVGGLPVLNFLYNWQGSFDQAGAALAAEAGAHIGAKIGARVNMLHNGCCGGGAAYIIPLILSGNGPDVYTGCCEDLAGFVSQGMLLNLDPYIKRDNINPNIWSINQYRGFTFPTGQYALPVYAGPHVFAYDQTVFDDLGLPYPEDDWDYTEATKIWRQVTATKGNQHRYGAQISWFNSYWEGPYLVRGWGGEEMNATHTRCELTSPQATAAMNWLYDLLDAGVLATRDINPWPLGTQTVFVTQWGGTIGYDASSLRNNYKWRYIPYPRWPARHATDMNIDFYGISSHTKYPELAWELLKEVSGPGTYWQRFITMRVTLTPPCLNSLWEEFIRIAETVAPPLRGRNLEAFMQTALNGWGFTQQYYAYEPVQADAILGTYLSKLAARALTPAEAMAQASQQIAALETAGATYQSEQNAALRVIDRDIAAGAPLPAPSVTGLGAPPTAAPKGAFASANGTVTLLGDGGDVWDPTTNCVFAGTTSTAETADFVCRVTTLANVDCPHLSQWAKVGLIACGDLSDVAAAITLELTGENGIQLQTHPYPGSSWSSQGPTSATAATGLIGPQLLTYPNTSKRANYLMRPVWLRLHRAGLSWTGFTSLDGKTWTAVSGAQGIEMGGAWVGLFATAHNDSFGGKGTIRVTFDHVSFPTTSIYQIGTP